MAVGAGRGAGGPEPEPAPDFVIVQALPTSRRMREPGDARKRRRWLLAGAVVIAGLAYAGFAEERHLHPPEVPRFGIVSLPFTDLANVPSVLDPGIATCGAHSPKPRDASGAFALVEQGWDVSALEGDTVDYSGGGTAFVSGGARATITYSARITTSDSEATPLQVSPLAFVYVRDGVVVGWAGSRFDFGASAFVTATSDSARTLTGPVPPADTICVGGTPVAGSVPAGEYQVYPVVRLLASPELAAEGWLFRRGFTVPDSVRDASGTSDSWDCRHPQSYPSGKVTSALCAAEPIGGVSINLEAESISVPYTDTYFAKNVDETLVGDPTVVTVNAVPFPSGPETPANASDLQCGAVLANLPWDPSRGAKTEPIDRSVMKSFGAAEASGGEGLRLALLPATSGVTQVTYPEPLRVWIYGWSADAQHSDTSATILGTAAATVAGGAPIPLDRVAGPSIATVTLANVRWCDGPDGPADAASIRGLTVTAGPATQIIYDGPATSALIGGLVWAGPVVVTADGATTSTVRLATWEAENSRFDDLTR